MSVCVQIHGDFSTLEKRMAFVIHLANQNIEHQTGGPFAAALFDMNSNQLVSVGVNIVVPSHQSANHAEMVAISIAQESLQTFSLREKGQFELLSSCEPCAMCFGALPWSGIKHLAYAASSADAQCIGFDEGPKHPQWIQELEKRGIQVTSTVLQQRGAQVLQSYQTLGGTIYNG